MSRLSVVALSLTAGVVLGLSGCSGNSPAAPVTAPQSPSVVSVVEPTPLATPDPASDVLNSDENGWDKSGEVILSNPHTAYVHHFTAVVRNPLDVPANYRVTGEWDSLNGALATKTAVFSLKPGETKNVRLSASVRYDEFDAYRVTTVERTTA